MNKQMAISMINDKLAVAKISEKEFLDKIEKLIPWSKWIGIIKPIYHKYKINRKPSQIKKLLKSGQYAAKKS